MLKVIETDTSTKKLIDINTSDPVEYPKVPWNATIQLIWLLHQDLSVKHRQKEMLIANIADYCHSDPESCENVDWINDIWERYYVAGYSTKIEDTFTFVETKGYSVEATGCAGITLNDFSEYTYLELIHGLPSVKAIVCESISNIKHFITVLNKRDIETREEIYKVEMKMFDMYPNKQFQFSIYHFQNQKDLDIFIRNKNILYFEH